MTPRRLLLLLALLLVLTPRRARAEDPWLGFGQGRLEDRLQDGDLDSDDLARVPALRRRGEGASSGLAQTWLSLVGFSRALPTGSTEYGAQAVFGIALDKVAAGPVRVATRRPLLAFADDATPTTPAPVAPAAPLPARPVAAHLARGAVRAAWHAAGLEANDERVESMIARSRASAALPETRLRAMRLIGDTTSTTTYIDSSGHIVDGFGADLTLEARLTWRLDRLLYADDEPTLERVRMERVDARSRVASHVLELLFAWQRAVVEESEATLGSRAELDATVRRWEAETALDVLTAGWFGAQPAVRATP